MSLRVLVSANLRRAALSSAALLGLSAAPLAGQRADTLALSLPEAVSLVQRSDEVMLAAAQVDLADAQVLAARASGLPQLRVNGSYQRVFESARGQAVGSVFNQPNTYVATANLSQSLFQGGRVFAASRAASRLRGAARFDAAEIRADATLAVQRAYLEALFSSRRPLDEATGEALASWAAGGAAPPAVGAPSARPGPAAGSAAPSGPTSPPADQAALEMLEAQLVANGLRTKQDRWKWFEGTVGRQPGDYSPPTEDEARRPIEAAEREAAA